MDLVRSELLGQFVNRLTADYMYYCYNRENLSQKVPMQTSLELKTCSRFFIAFLKSTLDFQYYEKKDHSQSLSITGIYNCQTVSYLNVQKGIFHATLPKTTCELVPNTAGLSTKPVSYHYSINWS